MTNFLDVEVKFFRLRGENFLNGEVKFLFMNDVAEHWRGCGGIQKSCFLGFPPGSNRYLKFSPVANKEKVPDTSCQ